MITTNQLIDPIGSIAIYNVFDDGWFRYRCCVVKVVDSRKHWWHGLQYEVKFGLSGYNGDRRQWVNADRLNFFTDQQGRGKAQRVWDSYGSLQSYLQS
jgi:hypothetical protein